MLAPVPVRTVLVVAVTLLLCAALAAILVTFDDDGREQLFGIAYDDYAKQGIFIDEKLAPSGKYISQEEAKARAEQLTYTSPLHARLVQIRQQTAPTTLSAEGALWAVDLDTSTAPDGPAPGCWGDCSPVTNHLPRAVVFFDAHSGDYYAGYFRVPDAYLNAEEPPPSRPTLSGTP